MGVVNQKLKVDIKFDSPAVRAGDDLTGTVLLCLPEPMVRLKLSLGLSGQEKVAYLINDMDWHTNHFEYPNRGGPLFAERDLEPGFYSFPFTFRSPRDLPGSMSTEDHCYKASIAYCLHVQLFSGDQLLLAKKVPLVIAQRPLEASRKIRLKTKAKVQAMKLFPRGHSEIKIDLNKECFAPGERVSIRVTVDNSQSALNMKCVDLVLHRVVRFEYKNGKKAEKAQVIYSCSTPAKVLSWESSMKVFNFGFPMMLKKKHLKGCGSAYGAIIKSKYLIEVSANYGTFSSKNKAYVPILIIPGLNQTEVMDTITDLVEMPPTLIDIS